MDQPVNGPLVNGNSHSHTPFDDIPNGLHEPTIEELERELPAVHDGQIPLGELVSRTMQAIYAELTELAETMPSMSDPQRKRVLADWVVKTKKQVVKLYAVVKWARDAGVVQKAMNVTAFLMDQNRQFEDAIHGLTYAKESLDPARLRNHDLLTSLDVLTTGSYRRLPTGIKKSVVPPTPLTDKEVSKALSDMEDVIRYRLRMNEIIPCEMANYTIADGRVHFVVPKLFEASMCLKGAQKDEGWFFVDIEFLFTVGGDPTGMQDFPRHPAGVLRRHIADEADNRLAFYLPSPPNQIPLPEPESPPRPQLPEGVVDAPLVRLFNFLQMMSMSYQLEILWYQAERLRSLGWADYLVVDMSNDRKTLTISYWIRKQLQHIPGRAPPPRTKLPPLGGTLTISIIPSQPSPPQSRASTTSLPSIALPGGHAPHRKPKDRVLMELQERAKLAGKGRPSDEVEGMKFDVKWEPQRGALGVVINPEDVKLTKAELAIQSDDLDIETLLKKVISRHTKAILNVFQLQLQRGSYRNAFGAPGEVTLVTDEGSLALRAHLCADEVVVITIEPRTGRLSLRDTGDLAAAGRGPKFTIISDRINENPVLLPDALVRLRFNTILDLAEQKANYLGLQSFRGRNFRREEMAKLGSAARATLYIQLSNFPSHYLVLVITDEDFRYALISVKVHADTMYAEMTMEDIGWLDVQRIHGQGVVVKPRPGMETAEVGTGQKRKRGLFDEGKRGMEHEPPSSSFRLETQVLRELYAYCCARVAYTKVEQQLKSRGIPYQHFNPSVGSLPELAHIHSSLARSIPALCVQSSDILSGAPAAEAAMPNIRVIPLNWWSDQKAQVVTCVKLKYVQQPVGKRAGGAVIRPSKRIIYDAKEAVVTFLSEDVDKCVDEFLEEWARVSKMVVIAREVAQMATEKRWKDVRLLSFDLQTVEFAYVGDYTVSITCTDQLSPTGGTYELSFSRATEESVMDTREESQDINQILAEYNPHEDVEPFIRHILRQGKLSQSLHKLVALLRDTLPIVAELEYIRVSAGRAGESIDTFAKTAGWFRILFGDLRHALDFRLLSGNRVFVLDASNSLFQPEDRPTAAPTRDNSVVLQPIPNFRSIVQAACKDVVAQHIGRKIAPVDIGIMCDPSTVRAVTRALYERVRRCLKETGSISYGSVVA